MQNNIVLENKFPDDNNGTKICILFSNLLSRSIIHFTGEGQDGWISNYLPQQWHDNHGKRFKYLSYKKLIFLIATDQRFNGENGMF